MAPSADSMQGVVTTTRCAGQTITYSFAADQPVTFTYHACSGNDCAACLLVGVQGIDAGHGRVSRGDKRPAADSCRIGRPARIAVPVARSRGAIACVEAQVMADCPVIYYDDDAGYDGHPPFQRLLRWLGGRHKIEAVGRARTDAGREKRGESHAGILAPIPFPWPWTSSNEHASIEAGIMAGCPVLHYHAAEYGNHPVFWSLVRLSGEVLGAAAVWVSGICGRRDPEMCAARAMAP